MCVNCNCNETKNDYSDEEVADVSKSLLPDLVLYNHQTAFDQFFVGMSFRGPIYYMATEDIFSLGWLSKLLRWAVAPIPIRKQTTDITAVMNCIKVAREGGSLCIAPEGNRTYSGRTEYMSDSIASLAKKLKMPIITLLNIKQK